jgi:hypothetical protein
MTVLSILRLFFEREKNDVFLAHHAGPRDNADMS